MNKWYHLTLSLATIAILSACSSSDDTPVPQIDKNDSVGICTGEQQSSTTNSVSVLVNCYDKDGIDLYGETADAPHILLSNGKKIYLSSIKEANILYENNEIIGVRDYQLIADLKDNSEMTAIAVMYSLNGNSLEYERVKSDNFILRTDKAEVPLEVVIPTTEPETPEEDTTAPVLSSTTQTFTSTVWTAITLENVTATDNVDGSVTVEISWDTVDSNTAWTYEVIYTATDEAGNETVIIHTYIFEVAPIPAPTIDTIWTLSVNDDGGGSGNYVWTITWSNIQSWATYSIVNDVTFWALTINSSTWVMNRFWDEAWNDSYSVTVKVKNPDINLVIWKEDTENFTLNIIDNF